MSEHNAWTNLLYMQICKHNQHNTTACNLNRSIGKQSLVYDIQQRQIAVLYAYVNTVYLAILGRGIVAI